MPRSARIDIPDILQHVVVKGIEKRDIFISDEDRLDFVTRLSRLLESTGTECLAWALLPNHFHLLVRVKETPLSNFMRRLLTGYAVRFNLRHGRSGHLFNNRYRSLVCDEDEYLIELVRYIHLNPLRAGVVVTMEELDEYPWSGHAVLVGRNELAGQVTTDVLSRFGRSVDVARSSYRMFVGNGIGQGQRDNFVGGGNSGKKLPAGNGPVDSRVLGDHEFVEKIMGRSQTRMPDPGIRIDRVIGAVLATLDVEESELMSRSRTLRVANARAIICHIAYMNGHRGIDIAKRLKISGPGITAAVRRGKEMIKKYPELDVIASDRSR